MSRLPIVEGTPRPNSLDGALLFTHNETDLEMPFLSLFLRFLDLIVLPIWLKITTQTVKRKPAFEAFLQLMDLEQHPDCSSLFKMAAAKAKANT